MRDLGGKVAAITGAASGIGRALAVSLAGEGCHVALSDIDAMGLGQTADMLRKNPVNVTTHVVDVARQDQVARYAAEVVRSHGGVHLLINNAGVVVTETLEDISYDDFQWLMGINLWGVVFGCKEFLPYLKQQREANIVNMSSVNGIYTDPNNGAYCTSKFAVRGFTETLCQELNSTSVKVSCVHPGGVKTDIARHARFFKVSDGSLSKDEAARLFDFLARTPAETAARIIIDGIKKDRPRIMVGYDAYVLDWLKRLFPVGFQRFVGRKDALAWVKKKAGMNV